MPRLNDTIALVTGASRGAGRGIALSLAEEGATVYLTGRSIRNNSSRSDLPGTVTETAEQAVARGGTAIPIRCDHTDDEQVAAVFSQIKHDHGRLDLLVNNVWGGYEGIDETFTAPFWKQPMSRWDKMFNAGVRAHFTASQHAARLMIPNQRGLIVNTTFWDRGKCLGNLPYDLAKTAINRMAYVMDIELREHGIATIALSPGWMRTEEAVLADFGLPTDDSVRERSEALQATESVFYIGRAVVALASDPDVRAKSGSICTVGDLAREYGFTDIDGTQPETFILPDEHLRD